ncbi:hypothetical protein [Streptomyces sp. NPDC056337]|uniref:hypothetical protein n=1 Tax=Streptomyces sp. NPDC056337 TaxID=3345787 RepID=UPI0035D7DF6F
MPDDPYNIPIEWARHINESLAASPAMESIRRSLADAVNAQNTEVNEAIARLSEASRVQMAQTLTRALAPAIESSRQQLDQAATNWARHLRAQFADNSGFRLNVSRLNLDTVLATSSFDALPAAQREWARRIVEDATAGVDTDEAADVPNEILDTLADTARTFSAAQPPGMSRSVQKKLFVGFIVTIFFLLLLQAQVESDAVKEMVENIGGAMLVVPLAAWGAARSFDMVIPEAADAEGDTGDGAA